MWKRKEIEILKKTQIGSAENETQYVTSNNSMEGLSIRMDPREGRRAEFEDKVEELGKKITQRERCNDEEE